MPMYRTPPSTPPTSPPPSRSSSPPASRSRSKRTSRSRSHSRSSVHSRLSIHSRSSSSAPAKESIIKTSLLFLGSVAAATFAAHKFWPKGVTYGDKEDWEKIEVKAHRKIKKGLREEKVRARREVPDRRAEYAYSPREERRARYREGGRGGRGAGGEYVATEEVYERVGPNRGGSRDRGTSRDRAPPESERDRDRFGPGPNSRSRASSRDRGNDVLVERQTSRRESRYYPPAPQRYTIDPPPPRRPSQDRAQQRRTWQEDPPQREREPVYVTRAPQPPPAVPELRSRPPSVERGPVKKYYDDEPGVVYVSRPAPGSRSRRASVDAGLRRPYDDNDDY